MEQRVKWPEGKRFAFSVFDDTDSANLENVRDVYAFLTDCGFRTTKSAWPVRPRDGACEGAATCEDPDYLRWLLGIQRRGFEIGWHMATRKTSTRDETLRGLEKFSELFGHDPRSMANHARCQENLYWGEDRLSGLHRWAYRGFAGWRNRGIYRGHLVGDELFWGDICRQRIKYVRNFDFADINTLKHCPMMPYHDANRPYVNYWYASADGHDVRPFNRCLAEVNQDRLEEEGGACIMYTHFARGFFTEGSLNPTFRSLMERLARMGGWYVPVADLLDHLLKTRGPRTITPAERRRIERKWILYKLTVGTT